MRVGRIALTVAGGTVAVVGLCAVVLILLIRSSFPNITGERLLPGLETEVRISRDEHGVAHIAAETLEDLVFAQGYLHASERLWQMEFQRRVVAGRLAEWFGSDLIEADTLLRRIDLAGVAERVVESADPVTRLLIQRYAEGVNAFLERGPRPLELRLLRHHPEPWSAYDVGAVPALMAFDLGQNWEAELVRQRMIEQVGTQMVAEILPPYEYRGPAVRRGENTRPPSSETQLEAPDLAPDSRSAGNAAPAPAPGAAPPEVLSQLRAVRDLARLGPIPRTGSNSWVVSGDRTADGVPHLANDVHLSLGLPSVWYELELEVPGNLWVRGFSIPGTPLVAVGHNRQLAWGLTNTGDTQDLYLERRHPDNRELFEHDERWYRAELREERMKVAGGDPEKVTLVETRNGRLIEDDPPLSLAWTAYQTEASIFDAVLGMAQAENWTEFRGALRSWTLPAQNVVYADREGTIAFRTAGLIPRRPASATQVADRMQAAGNVGGAAEPPAPRMGLIPRRGWRSADASPGVLSFDELPELVNPAQGYLATANHRVVEPPYPHTITADPQPPARMRRIVAQLEADDSIAIERSMEMQTDWYNQHAADRLPRFLQALDGHELSAPGRAAKAELHRWLERPANAPERAGPLIFSTWHYTAMRAAFAPHLGDELYQEFIAVRDLAYNSFEAVLEREHTGWTARGVDRVLRIAFDAAVDELVERHGPNVESWRWDAAQTIELEHVLGEMALLRPLFNRGPYAYGGGQMTVGRASYSLEHPFKVIGGAVNRSVLRLGRDGIEAWVSHFAGQSGHVGNRWYADQFEQWRSGEYRRVRHLAGDDPPPLWRKHLRPR